MKRAAATAFALYFLTLTASCMAAEEATATARAFPEKATIGDEIHFLIQVERPKKFTVQPPSRKINIAPFEVKSIENSPAVRGKNRIRETFTLTLTVFQLGDLTIPPVPIEVRDASGKRQTVLTDPVHVKVVSVGKKKDDKDDIRPIKGPVSFDLSKFRLWILGALLLILKIVLIVKIILRRRKKIVDPESLKPPHERAVLELERLKGKGLLEEKRVKEFYSELSDILRRYFERSFGIMALDRTTSEIISDLKKKEFSNSLIGKAKEVLENSDLVKFAKYEAPRSLAENMERRILDFVDETKPVEEEKTGKK